MPSRAAIVVILLFQLLCPINARADSGWDGMGSAFVLGVLPSLALVIGLFIYLLVSKVSKSQKAGLALLFLFSSLIMVILGVSHAIQLPLYGEAILFWAFPLCVCLGFTKWSNRRKKQNE